MARPDDVEWEGTLLVGPGTASIVRIPVPGTNGLCIQLDAPGGYKGSTSTLFFVEDASQKFGRQLRLDYGPRPTTVNGQKVTVIDYHWNQKGTMGDFGIPDHSPASPAGRYVHGAAKYFRYGGRILLVAGATFEAISIVKADKPLRRLCSPATRRPNLRRPRTRAAAACRPSRSKWHRMSLPPRAGSGHRT